MHYKNLEKGSFDKRKNMKRLHKHFYLLFLTFVLLVVLVGLYFATNGAIFSFSALYTLAFQLPVLGFLTLAQAVAMINGGIDLSIISVANFVGIVTAMLLKQHVNVVVSVLTGLSAAVVIGSVNGALVSQLNAPPLMVTLATGFLVRGVALGLTKGYIISGLPKSFLFIGSGTILNVPVSFLLMVIFVFFSYVFLYKTVTGETIYASGANPLASKFMALNVSMVKLQVYIVSSLFAGIAGLVMSARFNAAQADYGGAFLLITVLICVLSGIDPAGGVGRIENLVIALLSLQIISTGFNIMRTSSYLASALWGILLIVTILFSKKIGRPIGL